MNKTTILLIPVHNDWESLIILLERLNQLQAIQSLVSLVLLVDDGSTEQPKRQLPTGIPIEKIQLAVQLGHQKAIATGLAHIYHNCKADQVLIMDADGEDRPEDAGRLLTTATEAPDKIIVARRTRRWEGPAFRLFYYSYKAIFRLLTGEAISFGHFMLIPAFALERLVYYSETWSNLPATVIKSKLPLVSIATEKGKRYAGSSKMNFQSLLLHGLGAIAVFVERIATRLLTLSLCLILGSFMVILVILAIKWFTPLAIPGWASLFLSSMLVVLLQGFLLSFFTLFLFLSSQSYRKFIPAQHYKDYIRPSIAAA